VPDQVLDARGLACPLPVLRARKAMGKLAPGAVLEVLATDPGAVRDFDAFCEATGHELLDRRQEGSDLIFLIRKAARP
jgi:tRNA 2-thiouridine synthesizing protein A